MSSIPPFAFAHCTLSAEVQIRVVKVAPAHSLVAATRCEATATAAAMFVTQVKTNLEEVNRAAVQEVLPVQTRVTDVTEVVTTEQANLPTATRDVTAASGLVPSN